METEPRPRPAGQKPSITRRLLRAFIWICFLGWPVLLAIPNPILGDDVWIGVLLAWLLVLLIEALFPTRRRASSRRTIGGDIVSFLFELLLSFRGPSS